MANTSHRTFVKIPSLFPSIVPSSLGLYGIIALCLVDPLSQLISKISRLPPDDVNAVGFYYPCDPSPITPVHESSEQVNRRVILFNTYDNGPVSWVGSEYTLESLLSSPFVSKITYYSLSDNIKKKAFLLTRESLSSPSNIKVSEAAFRSAVVEVISANTASPQDKNLSYTSLLLKAAGIQGSGLESLPLTGYTLVNRVLLSLMKTSKLDIDNISEGIIPCRLLKRPISLRPSVSNEVDVRDMIKESGRDITRLVTVFVDLFTSHPQFRHNVLNVLSGNPEYHTSPSLSDLFAHETTLVSYIVGAFENGTVNNKTLNEIIHNLMRERFNLGNYQQLPFSSRAREVVSISDIDATCTFSQPLSSYATDPLRDLGNHIKQIVDTFGTPDVLTIDLFHIISAYNNAIRGTTLSPILIPEDNLKSHTMSRSAVVTMPGDPAVMDCLNKITGITMYNGDLTSLADGLLLDILVYIDSLRCSDGSSDSRFASLQNEVTHELARRRRSSQI